MIILFVRFYLCDSKTLLIKNGFSDIDHFNEYLAGKYAEV